MKDGTQQPAFSHLTWFKNHASKMDVVAKMTIVLTHFLYGR